MITLKDIARRCGKNVSTVSRALRDDPRVTETTRKRIQALAKEMGYTPNLAARNLVAGASKTVWFVLPELDNPLSQTPARAAGMALRRSGYDLLVAPFHEDEETLSRIIDRLGQGVCDAAIMIPGPPTVGQSLVTERLIHLAKSGYPLVFLDRHLEEVPVPVVTTDNVAAAKELASRCFDAGAKAIISLYSQKNTVEKSRHEGILAEAKRRCLPVLTTPTALPDHIAIAASNQQNVLRFIGERSEALIDKTVEFAVFDNWEGGAQPGNHAFVCIQDMNTMGKNAVKHLIGRLSGRVTRIASRKITVPHKEIRVIAPQIFKGGRG